MEDAQKQDGQEKAVAAVPPSNPDTWMHYHSLITCNSCGEIYETEAASLSRIHWNFIAAGWRIVRRRKLKSTEVMCPDCVEKEVDVKAARKAAIAAAQKSKDKADAKLKALRKGG